MNAWNRLGIVWLAVAMAIAACAPAQSPAAPGVQVSQPDRPGAVKRITAAIRGNPPSVSMDVNTAGGSGHIPGADELEEILNTRLSMVDNSGIRHPQLTETVPTVDNGLWKVLPDGRMEMTWKIKPHAHWHDGTPFTAEDLVFSYQVEEDDEIAAFGDSDYKSIERMEAADHGTLVVYWKQPYIFADDIFDVSILPKHILGTAFLNDKASFTQLPFWKH
ncbi:MAG: hypothetical protein GEU73_07020 [Chloroflexi bacterium]|nr:hypothetical protein [Chloroflexota bacterium]